MSFSHNITQTFSRAGEIPLGSTVTVTGSAEATISVALGESATDTLQAISLDVSEMQSLFLLSTVDCTVEANKPDGPAFTISLVANRPLVWTSGNGTNPFSADVTALYTTNTDAGQFDLRVLYNA